MSETNFELSDEFLENVVKDTEINDFQLKEQLRTVTNKTQRYIEELYKQKRKLKQLERFVKKVKGELFQHYKNDFEIKLTSSSDVMTFVERDKKYQTAKRHYDDLETIVDFLDRTIKNMNNKAWTLRNMVELEKMNL
jgi:oligoribonuclease NrnB/cAMP/cGMP phosphodiesterase (DHH superfamily)